VATSPTTAPARSATCSRAPGADPKRAMCAAASGGEHPRRPAGPLDVVGLVLCSVGVQLVIYGLSRTVQSGGFGTPAVLGPIVVGLACLAAFAVHARTAPRPLLDIRLLRDAGFSAAVLGTFCIGAALFGAMLLLPLYFQVVRAESALNAGLLLIPQALGAAIPMPISGRMTDRVGGGRVAVVGIAVMTLRRSRSRRSAARRPTGSSAPCCSCVAWGWGAGRCR